MVLESRHLQIGSLIYPELDQADFTAPFEVLSRVPNSTFHVVGKTVAPVRDAKGLILTPEVAIADAPRLDVICVPGGTGIGHVMEDETVLDFLRLQASGAMYVFCVCTGSLVCAAAGLLKGKRATTHWASFDLLPFFGAIPIASRVVIDGKLITTAGVTAGIDGALRLASWLRGDVVAQQIQLYMEYAPEPPFNSGTPETAPPEVLAAVRAQYLPILQERVEVCTRISKRLGISIMPQRG